MSLYKKARSIRKFICIGVHQVNGDLLAIKYLVDGDQEVVETLFYAAKKYGEVEFYWEGDKYNIIRNRDLTFTVNLIRTEEEKEVTSYR